MQTTEIFYEAKEQQLMFLRMFLTIFRLFQALVLILPDTTYSRSAMFLILTVWCILRCNIRSIPTKYLALPLGKNTIQRPFGMRLSERWRKIIQLETTIIFNGWKCHSNLQSSECSSHLNNIAISCSYFSLKAHGQNYKGFSVEMK